MPKLFWNAHKATWLSNSLPPDWTRYLACKLHDAVLTSSVSYDAVVDFFCKPWCRVDFFCKPWPSHWYNMLIGDYIIYKLWGLGFITEWCGHLWNTTCVVRISLEMLTHKVNCAINCFVRYRVKFRCRQQHCTISSFNQQSLICSVWLQSVLIELQE